MKYKLVKPLEGISTPVGTKWESLEDICIQKYTSDLLGCKYWALSNDPLQMNLLIATGFIEAIPDPKEWEPKEDDDYWYIDSDGEIELAVFFKDSERAKDCKKFMGIYPTKESAESALKKIKEAIKNI